MKQAGSETAPSKAARSWSAGHRVACVFMVLAVAGLLVAVALGATLVSILLVGLLLLCPLLMWVPFRLSEEDRDQIESLWRARRG